MEHQGLIEVKQPGRGSVFELYFPATADKTHKKDTAMDDHDLDGNGKHILVVDDEETIRTMVEKMLITLGYRVSLVSSGEEAIAFLQTNTADLLLLDMLMEPGINGYQTYQKIKEFHPDQKALIASGFSESIDVKKAQTLGAGAYIKKPYTLRELGLAIKRELAA
jgi:CheY-like chemotaxis protein